MPSAAAAVAIPSPHQPRQPSRSSTDKTALLSALAQELKNEKLNAEKAAREMVHCEHLVEQKHSEFIAEQDRLTSVRDRNNVEIATLRRRLKSLKLELEEAQNVREEEAQLYFDLLQGHHSDVARTGLTSAAAGGGGGGGGQSFQSNQFSTGGQPRYGSIIPAEYGVTQTITTPFSSSPEHSPSHSPAPSPRATATVQGPVSPRLHDHPDRFDQARGALPEEEENKETWANKVLSSLSMKKRRNSGNAKALLHSTE